MYDVEEKKAELLRVVQPNVVSTQYSFAQRKRVAERDQLGIEVLNFHFFVRKKEEDCNCLFTLASILFLFHNKMKMQFNRDLY